MYSPRENLLPDCMPRRPSTGGGGWFDLEDWVGPQHPSRRGDVAKIEAILANSGDFPIERFQGPTGYWGLALDDGIRRYQKRNGLKVDGALRPGGPTISHMRENFSTLFDGYEPPTPEDIDAHQNVVGDDDPGTIAWRRPDVSFENIPDLPEIDQATDASNARLARAMGKTSDLDGYAKLCAQAIEDGGLGAVAEVKDLAGKLEALRPGESGRFLSAVTGCLPKGTLDELGLKAPEAPPPGTKVAVTDVLGDLAVFGRLLGTAAAAKHGADETKRIIEKTDDFKLPGFTPADNENKPVQAPPPALLDVPIHTGGDAEPPKASDLIETFPKLPEEKRQPIIDDIGAALFPTYMEMRYGDRDENRANDRNARTTNIIIEKFMELVEASHIPEMIHQRGGGSDGGKLEKCREEATIPNEIGTFNRPDGSFQLEGAEKMEDSVHFNVQSTKKDGTPTEREQTSMGRLKDVLGEDGIDGYPKWREGQSVQDHDEEAKAFAVRLFDRYYAKLWKLPNPK